MEKWFFMATVCIAFSVSLMLASNTYNATKAGLEECPKKGAVKVVTQFGLNLVENIPI